jgi:hypothetical protein
MQYVWISLYVLVDIAGLVYVALRIDEMIGERGL